MTRVYHADKIQGYYGGSLVKCLEQCMLRIRSAITHDHGSGVQGNRLSGCSD